MLKPGGKCFIVNMTMYMKTYSHFLPIYKERCDENKKFQEWESNHKDSKESKNPFNYHEFPGNKLDDDLGEKINIWTNFFKHVIFL